MLQLSTKEFFEIFLAVLISTIILTYPDFSPEFFIISFIITFISISFHEFAHKYFAIKFKREEVRIRMHIPGLMIGLFLAILSNGNTTLMIPAYVSYKLSRVEGASEEEISEELLKESKILMAGPFVNGLISLISILFLFLIKYLYGGFLNYLEYTIEAGVYITYILPLFLLQLAHFNGMLSFVNLLPFFGTDGEGFASIASYFYGREKYYRRLPWNFLAICIVGVLIYFIVGWIGLLSGEIIQAYENIIGET